MNNSLKTYHAKPYSEIGSKPLRGKREAFCLWRSRNGGNLKPSSAYKSAGYLGDRIAISSNSGSLMLDLEIRDRIDWLNENDGEAQHLFLDLVQKRREAERTLKAKDIRKLKKKRKRESRERRHKPISPLPDEQDEQTLEALIELVLDDATAAVKSLQRSMADPSMVRQALDLHRAAVSARESHLDGLRNVDATTIERASSGAYNAAEAMNSIRRYLSIPEVELESETIPEVPQKLKDIDRTERLLRENLRWNFSEYENHVLNKGDIKEALRLLETMLKTLIQVSRLATQRARLQVATMAPNKSERIELELVVALLKKMDVEMRSERWLGKTEQVG